MAGLKRMAIRGSLWVSLGSFGTQVINFIIKIFLARLLAPSDFGLFAMALIVVTFLNLLSGFGIGGELIYRKKNIDKALNVAFFLSPVIGVVLYSVIFLLSGYVGAFFNQPSLPLMIKVIGISFIIDSFVTAPHAFLTKNLRFKERSLAEFLPIIFYGASAVALSYYGFGVWSLVISQIVQHLSWVIFLWAFCPWRPKLMFDRKIMVEILHFGKYVFSSSMIAFFINYIDNAIVGKKLGDEPLGFYSFAFNIAALPITAFVQFVSGVFHPIYSRLQDNNEKLKEAFRLSLKWILLFALPVSGGLWALADLFTLTVFGSKWAPMIIILQILSIYPSMKSIIVLSTYLIEGVGYPKRSTKTILVNLILMAIFIYPALKYYGVVGVAYTVIISLFITTILIIRVTSDIIGFGYKDILSLLWRPMLSTCIMVLAILVLRMYLFAASTLISFIALVAAGIVSYGISSFALERKLIREIKEMVGHII